MGFSDCLVYILGNILINCFPVSIIKEKGYMSNYNYNIFVATRKAFFYSSNSI